MTPDCHLLPYFRFLIHVFLKTIGSYKRFGAWAMLLVFLTGWSVGTLHRLSSHHDHSGQPECITNRDPNAAHIHDQIYPKVHCPLCAFVLSTPELLSITAILSAPGVIAINRDSFQCTPCRAGTIHDATCLRDPPGL